MALTMMPTHDVMHRDRAWLAVLGVLTATFLAGILYLYGPHAPWLAGCMFRRLTGLACPGCGMTRATHAALHGQLGLALRFNPLGMLLVPVALLGIGVEVAAWVRGQAVPVKFRLSDNLAWWLVGVVLCYWVARNLPCWPFNLLEPL